MMETCRWGQCSYKARRGGDNDLLSPVSCCVPCVICYMLYVMYFVECHCPVSTVSRVQAGGRSWRGRAARLESTQPRLQPQRRSGGGAGGFCRDINFFLKGSSK